MKISELFAGSYFKASDLPQPRVLTIEAVLQAKMPQGDTKPTLKFIGESQQLVLNKTNGFICIGMFGDNGIAWQGRQVELYATQTSYGGKMVDCIRVRQPQQAFQQPVYQPQPAPQVPQQQVQQPVYQVPQPVPQPQPIIAPEDDYPFPVDA